MTRSDQRGGRRWIASRSSGLWLRSIVIDSPDHACNRFPRPPLEAGPESVAGNAGSGKPRPTARKFLRTARISPASESQGPTRSHRKYGGNRFRSVRAGDGRPLFVKSNAGWQRSDWESRPKPIEHLTRTGRRSNARIPSRRVEAITPRLARPARPRRLSHAGRTWLLGIDNPVVREVPADAGTNRHKTRPGPHSVRHAAGLPSVIFAATNNRRHRVWALE